MDTGLLRDQATQLAKQHGDDVVEPRHVLAVLLEALKEKRPADLDAAFVTKLLGARGNGWQTPKPTEAAESLLAELEKATKDQAVEIARRVASAQPDAPPGPGSTTSTTDAGGAAVEHPPTGDAAT